MGPRISFNLNGLDNEKMHSYCRLALFSVREWHVYIRKKARNKRTQLQHRNRLLYTKDKKKAGEIKRRDETREERRPDKRNERIKNTKKIVYFSSLVCCSHFALARE